MTFYPVQEPSALQGVLPGQGGWGSSFANTIAQASEGSDSMSDYFNSSITVGME